MKKTPIIEVKIQTEALYTLKILSNNVDDIAIKIADLADDKVFNQAPVILEIVNKHFQANELAVLVEILGRNNIYVVGVRTNKQEIIDFAKFSGLAIFSELPSVSKNKELQQEPIPPIENKAPLPPKIINNQVRSSMQVLAKNGDLVLLDKVRADAEILANGSIAAYKEVCGKVFAGISGDKTATIFIRSFNPQLVSIAGVYRQFNPPPTHLCNRQVMIDLTKGRLRFRVV